MNATPREKHFSEFLTCCADTSKCFEQLEEFYTNLSEEEVSLLGNYIRLTSNWEKAYARQKEILKKMEGK